MKKIKKIIASILSASFAFTLCNFNKANAYYAGQMHTWRVYEKVSAASHIYEYNSRLQTADNYTYVSNERLELIKDFYYLDGYNPETNTLTNIAGIYEDDQIITDEGYLTMSTWRTSTKIEKFNANYSYETSSGAAITLVPIMIGDVNQDKYVNKLDTEKLSQYLLGSAKLGEKELLAADVDNNGKVDIQDAISIDKFVSGSIKHF